MTNEFLSGSILSCVFIASCTEAYYKEKRLFTSFSDYLSFAKEGFFVTIIFIVFGIFINLVGNFLLDDIGTGKNEYQQRLDSLQETKLRLEVERLKKIDSTFKK